MMKNIIKLGGVIALLLFFTSGALAEVREVEKTNVTPSGVIVRTTYVQGIGSDQLAIGDPYGNRTLSKRALEGPSLTQQPYPENCQESRCMRAKKRQYSSPYWSR